MLDHVSCHASRHACADEQDADADSLEVLVRLICDTSGLFNVTATMRRVRTLGKAACCSTIGLVPRQAMA